MEMETQPRTRPAIRRDGGRGEGVSRIHADVSVANTGLDLGYPPAVMVKMVLKRHLVPAGVEFTDPIKAKERDAQHKAKAKEAGDVGKAYQGRHRPGRVDTGEQVIKREQGSVSADFLRRALSANDFYLTAVYAAEREDGKIVLTIIYAHDERAPDGVETPIELDTDVQTALRELSQMAWANCYVWDNGDEKPATVNLSGLLQGQKPKQLLTSRSGRLQLVDPA